jgi:hypothetical protein
MPRVSGYWYSSLLIGFAVGLSWFGGVRLHRSERGLPLWHPVRKWPKTGFAKRSDASRPPMVLDV